MFYYHHYHYRHFLFYKGIYKDKKGIQVSDSDVLASIILSDSENRFSLQLYNYDKNPSNNLKIYFDFSKIVSFSNIESITNVFSGDTYTLDGNILTLNLAANEFTSLVFEYEKIDKN